MLKQSIIVLLAAAASASAVEIQVNQLFSPTGTPVEDRWYKSDIQGAGTASIVDLTGTGGNLESSQPSTIGAAKLTTGASNSDKAVVSTYANFGLASSVLNDISLGYSFYKTENLTENAAAPALKLIISNPGGPGDSFGALIYEPYWNSGGTVMSNTWQTLSIDQDTGAGGDGAGGWWWNGGFGVSNSAGGPPLKSLAEWLAIFNAADATSDTGFENAKVVGLEVGVGSYNPKQTDYFDNVSIKTGSVDKTYNFTVPDNGSTAALLGLGFVGMVWVRSRQRAAANV